MNKFSKALEKRAREKRIQKEAARNNDSHNDTPERNAEPSDRGMIKPTERIIVPSSSIDKCVVALHDPRANIAEQYRTLRTNLKSLKKKTVKTILISSAVEGEGKTVTALNLAFTFAQDAAKKVLLVDADLRRSRLGSYLGLEPNIAGFKDVLEKRIEFDDALMYTEKENLHILPNRNDHAVYNAAELLESSEMKKILAYASSEYDYVIFDSPPILPVTDAAVIGAQVDGVLMVFKAGKTQRNTIRYAQQMFEQVGVNLLGHVMTSAECITPGNRDYYYTNYNY